ncbi:MAG: hypothetical protein LQ337_003953 [Flavoplaca oasis]|nr:MAG: hypothetical protein LQ337_003953 [Flavoplaca oasis]
MSKTELETIKGLNDHLQKVRSEIAPRRKFTFKSAPKRMPAVSPSKAPDEAPMAKSSSQSTYGSVQLSDLESAGVGGVSATSSFRNLCQKFCFVPVPTQAGDGVVLADIDRCVIKIDVPSQSLTTKSVHSSIIVAGPINGAAHVTRLAGSVLIVSCQQLRMHDCRNCDVYLQCSSNPMIEHCSEVRFAPLQEFVGLGVPEGKQQNMWDQVNDFNWLKAGHSPNWSVLNIACRFGVDGWNTIQSLTEGDPVDTVLDAFGIS